MKFRAKINSLLSIRNFVQLVHALTKVAANKFILRMAPDKFIILITEKEVKNSGVTAWCEFSTETFFTEYLMEGLSLQDNEIYLEITSENLASVLTPLKNSQNTNSLKLKLTRKQGVPCFTIEIETQNRNSTSLCVHDIPITLIVQRSWAEYQLPNLPPFNISLCLPEVKTVRQTLERLKNLSTHLRITAKGGRQEGQIIASVENMAVKSSVTYNDLRTYRNEASDDMETDDEEDEGRQRAYRVDVDVRNLFLVLPTDGLKVKPNSSICSVVPDRLLHLHYIFDDVSLQYCIRIVNVYED